MKKYSPGYGFVQKRNVIAEAVHMALIIRVRFILTSIAAKA